jgi:hypothetical protein
LLSLPTATELTDLDEIAAQTGADLYLYESLRLGALLFSIAVVFPVPVTVGMVRNMIKQLRIAILAVRYRKDGNGWAGRQGMCLWLYVLGGIAAEGVLEERSFFVDGVRQLSVFSGLQTWREVVGVIDSYLWMETACDIGGRELWSEVIEIVK